MTSPSTVPDLEQSGERSLGGILIHPLALFTAFIGPAIVYAVSNNEFTRENARYALNWHVTVIVLAVVATATNILGADTVSVNGEPIALLSLPAPIDAVLAFVGILLTLATAVAILATIGYVIVATKMAMSGSVWQYPGAVDVVARFL